MAKNKTLNGITAVIILQTCSVFCTLVDRQAKDHSYAQTDFNPLQIRLSPKRNNSQGSKGEHLPGLKLIKRIIGRTNRDIESANTAQGNVNTLLRKFNSADSEHTSNIKNNGTKSKTSFRRGKTTFMQNYERLKLQLTDQQHDLPLTRPRRSTQGEYSQTRAHRSKRDLSGDTEVGLIVGACVLGLLTAFLLICACMR